jgi:hypothetical protein
VLVVDDVNTFFNRLSFERSQIRKFLERNTGTLKHPVRLVFFSWFGSETQAASSRDGRTLLAAFDQHIAELGRFHGVYPVGAVRLSLATLQKIAAVETPRVGRKLVVWIGSGWPTFQEVNVSAHERQGVFDAVVSVSTALREARITLYIVNPGGSDSIGTYYEAFLKPVMVASKAEGYDLNLQVLAVQSGGVVEMASNDVISIIEQCIAETDTFYTLTVIVPLDGAERFHNVEVRVSGARGQVKTRNGYDGQR